MLWGCFGVSVPWTLVKVEGIMKNENILKENLKQSPTNLCLGRCSWWSECNWLPYSKLWPENRRGEPKTKVHQIWRSLMYLPKKAELGLFRRNNSRLLNKKDTQLVTRIKSNTFDPGKFWFCKAILFLCAKQNNASIKNKTIMFGEAVLKMSSSLGFSILPKHADCSRRRMVDTWLLCTCCVCLAFSPVLSVSSGVKWLMEL